MTSIGLGLVWGLVDLELLRRPHTPPSQPLLFLLFGLGLGLAELLLFRSSDGALNSPLFLPDLAASSLNLGCGDLLLELGLALTRSTLTRCGSTIFSSVLFALPYFDMADFTASPFIAARGGWPGLSPMYPLCG